MRNVPPSVGIHQILYTSKNMEISANHTSISSALRLFSCWLDRVVARLHLPLAFAFYGFPARELLWIMFDREDP